MEFGERINIASQGSSPYEEQFKQKYLPWFASGHELRFCGCKNHIVVGRIFPAAKSDAPVIILLPGRTESIIKYAETCFDLYNQGFCIAAYDHRGQGKSGRLTKHPQVGHVEQFEDYATDFQLFLLELSKTLPNFAQRRLYLLAHSMGAAVFLLWQSTCLKGKNADFNAKFLDQITTCVFTAPLTKINIGNIPTFFLAFLLKTRILFGAAQEFVIQPGELDLSTYGNDLTNCPLRLHWYRMLLKDNPALQLGAPSNRWMLEAICFQHKLKNIIKNQLNLKKSRMLILLPEQDQVMVNHYSHKSFRNCPNATIIKIANSQHDLFIETDEVRKKVIDTILSHINENTPTT